MTVYNALLLFLCAGIMEPTLSWPWPGSMMSSSPLLSEFASLFAGQYSNMEQYLEDQANNVTGQDKHFWLQFFYVPVDIPALAPAVTFYYELVVAGSSSPARQQVYAFTKESPCSVRQASYEIANSSRFSTRPAGLRALTSLSTSELSNRRECDAIWRKTGEDSFRSELATDRCNFTFFGKEVRPEGHRNLSCDGLTFVETFNQISDGAVVSGTSIRYDMQLVGQRYSPPFSVVPGCVQRPCRPKTATPGPSFTDIKQLLSQHGA
ncbi:uncharacterized protein LOC101856816 isoform X2 [Aplysia californica]|uniref:Uncharacterized protein LOC101856816 isoform X2 n=1 Tax=Aplysia californica TaxID=6500 RepID=A0ABM0JUI2_APLCA|nr:uncharacterized protein LOC101856816 isoform X2 [Aplysia californica]